MIDSDDLLEDPAGIVAAYCAAVGIPFIPQALNWHPGARDEVSWCDQESWHQNLRNSDGLKPQPRKYVDICNTPDRVREMYEIVLPHYKTMLQRKLAPRLEERSTGAVFVRDSGKC